MVAINGRRIYTEVLRTSFVTISTSVVLILGFEAIRTTSLFLALLGVWATIVVARGFSVILFPDDREEPFESYRERIANFWASVVRTALVAPLVSAFFVLRVQSGYISDALNIVILVLWVFITRRKSGWY